MFYFSKKEYGFTLLELLIVIGIIGILASITIISYPSYTKKARLANALRFSDNVRGSLQQDMVAWWKFDETTGTIAKDTWWNQLDGIVYNGATWVPGIKNNALSFDGTDDYVSGGAITSITGGDMSFCAWAKTNVAFGATTQVVLMYPRYQHLLGGLSGKWFAHIGGSYSSMAYSINNAVIGQWTFLCGIYTSNDTTVKLYVDGVFQNQDSSQSYYAASTIALRIGSRWGDGSGGTGNYFNGLIDDVQIYSAALPVAVIQQHYAQGLATHPSFLAEK